MNGVCAVGGMVVDLKYLSDEWRPLIHKVMNSVL